MHFRGEFSPASLKLGVPRDYRRIVRPFPGRILPGLIEAWKRVTAKPPLFLGGFSYCVFRSVLNHLRFLLRDRGPARRPFVIGPHRVESLH